MNSTHTIHVCLGPRSYDITIGAGILDQVVDQLAALLDPVRVMVITDNVVEPLHGRRVAELLAETDLDVHLSVVDAGEEAKCPEVAAELWESLLTSGADRKTVVVAVGGGVIGDLAGYVAATYTRGVPFFQIPTTLLAQVDSSVGGKVGINLPGAKNMVGAFWQPRGVLIDTDTLSTLPEREYVSGLAEVVKYGVILDAEFFAYLEKHQAGLLEKDPEVLRAVIARSCQLKAEVVEQDEREETGLRAVLNYGHTFAHAIEATTGYGTYLHGEAVSLGMVCAARLAERLGRVDSEFVERQRSLLAGLKLPVDVQGGDFDEEQMIEAMSHDKKVEKGRLRFVLPTRIGQVELVGDIPEDDVRAALREA